MRSAEPIERPRIVLVAPNVSQRMGGEALKALQIHQTLRDRGFDVHQITHARVRSEIEADFPEFQAHYVEDTRFQKILHILRLGPLLAFHNAWGLHRLALTVARTTDAWLVHFASPISPVVPYFKLPEIPVVIGPLNGNIYHPKPLAHRETLSKRFGKWVLGPMQALSGALFHGKQRALILVSGGARTRHALALGGCAHDRLVDTLDSGIPASLEADEPMRHDGSNPSFVFAGRLVRYKGCDLAIRAVALCDPAIELEVIGDGVERARLEVLAASLGVSDRIHFSGWVEAGDALFGRLRRHRALVMPTLAEANGIGVQEAMMIGLPVICVAWGGPADLLEPGTGILIAPDSEEVVVARLAEAMMRLARDGRAADALSQAARAVAISRGFTWQRIVEDWIETYDRAIAEYGNRSVRQWLSAHNPETEGIDGPARSDASSRRDQYRDLIFPSQ